MAETNEQFCGHCGQSAVIEMRVNHTSREGVWQAVCQDYLNEQHENAADVNEHEMRRFGGAHGLVSVETRSLQSSMSETTTMAGAELDELEKLAGRFFDSLAITVPIPQLWQLIAAARRETKMREALESILRLKGDQFNEARDLFYEARATAHKALAPVAPAETTDGKEGSENAG